MTDTLKSGKRVIFAYQRDPAGHRVTRFGAAWSRGLRQPLSSLPSSWMKLAACVSPLLDQEGGSCTAHASVTCLETAMTSAGTPMPFHCSTSDVYHNGRAIDRVADWKGNFAPLRDEGAMPNQVDRAIEAFGVRPTRKPVGDSNLSDTDLATINDEPSLADLEVSAHACPVISESIPDCSSGASLADVVSELCSALSATEYNGIAICGLPVKTGAWVDRTFMDWESDEAVGASNPMNGGGNHAFALIAYRTNARTGKKEFLLRNSWGSWGVSVDLGDGRNITGCVWVSEEFIASCFDFRVVLPKVSFS